MGESLPQKLRTFEWNSAEMAGSEMPPVHRTYAEIRYRHVPTLQRARSGDGGKRVGGTVFAQALRSVKTAEAYDMGQPLPP